MILDNRDIMVNMETIFTNSENTERSLMNHYFANVSNISRAVKLKYIWFWATWNQNRSSGLKIMSDWPFLEPKFFIKLSLNKSNIPIFYKIMSSSRIRIGVNLKNFAGIIPSVFEMIWHIKAYELLFRPLQLRLTIHVYIRESQIGST